MNFQRQGLPQQCQDRGYFNLAPQTVATLTFCLPLTASRLPPVVSCLLSVDCCLTTPVAPTGMSAVNIYAAQYTAKGDVVSFLTAAEFVACLTLAGCWLLAGSMEAGAISTNLRLP